MSVSMLEVRVLEAIGDAGEAPSVVVQKVSRETVASGAAVRDAIWWLIGRGILRLSADGVLQKTSKP